MVVGHKETLDTAALTAGWTLLRMEIPPVSQCLESLLCGMVGSREREQAFAGKRFLLYLGLRGPEKYTEQDIL